jgi:hypothetical protein
VIADAYLDWMLWQAAESGAVLVAESGGMVIGLVAGWIERTENIAETADSNRVGYNRLLAPDRPPAILAGGPVVRSPRRSAERRPIRHRAKSRRNCAAG